MHTKKKSQWNDSVCLFLHCNYLRSFVSAAVRWGKWVAAVITPALLTLSSSWQQRTPCQGRFSIVSIRTRSDGKIITRGSILYRKLYLKGNFRKNNYDEIEVSQELDQPKFDLLTRLPLTICTVVKCNLNRQNGLNFRFNFVAKF